MKNKNVLQNGSGGPSIEADEAVPHLQSTRINPIIKLTLLKLLTLLTLILTLLTLINPIIN